MGTLTNLETNDSVFAAAVLDRLDEEPGLVSHDSGGSGTPPYVVVYMGDGRRSGDRMVLASRNADVIITTHSVGLTTAAARIVRGKVLALLLDHVLVVDGWQCWPIRHDLERPPGPDESTGTTVISAVDQWRLHAERKD